MNSGRKNSGFSLLELLITTGVVALGLLALVGSLAFAARAARTGEMASLAMGHSIHIVELIRSRNLDFPSYGTVPPPNYSGINDPPAARKQLNEYPFHGDFPAETPFRRNISIKRQSNDSDDYNYNVVNITVSIYWQENGEDRSVTIEATHKKP